MACCHGYFVGYHLEMLFSCSLITSRVEVNILRSINPHFAKVKVMRVHLMHDASFYDYNCLQDTAVKQNLIRTIDLIGKALHPSHLKTTNFVFAKRKDLLEHLLVQLCVVELTMVLYNCIVH